MRNIIFLLSIITCTTGFCQSNARLSIALSRPDVKDMTKSHFIIKVMNTGFDQYWVQDTSYLAANVESPLASFIHPIIWRKINGKYQVYELLKNRLHALPSKCADSCCNCIIVYRGDSLTFSLDLLKCYRPFDKGEYKVQAYLRAPTDLCNACEQIVELESNYLYFTVKD
jgi:hypothetical protein